jgi:hypothetical protein
LSAADDPTLTFASADDWEAWLEESGASAAGVWIKVAKKGSGIASVTHAEALDVALCFGWIDGQRKSFDEQYFLQRFTPRRPRSIWSQRNREHIERLTAAGRMRPAGRREVDAAKADGRWDAAYEAQGSAECRTTCSASWTPIRRPRRSSRPSPARTGTRSCSVWPPPSAPRPALAASRRSSRCSARARRCTDRPLPSSAMPSARARALTFLLCAGACLGAAAPAGAAITGEPGIVVGSMDGPWAVARSATAAST